MTGERAGRFVLAPIVDGAANWAAATDLVLAPIRLSNRIVVDLPLRQPRPGSSR